jgi:putative nucleotidyltransferase with HDIG domain
MHQSDLDIRGRLSVARLPAMPQILLKLIEHCQGDETGMSELAELVAKDAAMATKIIGVANSSAYHNRGRLVSLEQSLISLGTDMVKTLLISESVFQIFGDFSQPNGIDLRGFWKHSLTAAVAARMIAAKINYPHIEEAYLAGLLHDVGRLALFASAPREYEINFFAADDDNLCAVEQRTLQITHAEAGAWIIERWNLDSFLADSVLYHHEPLARLENAHPLIRTVCVAHLLAAGGENVPTFETAAALCGISPADLALIRNRAAEEVKKTAEYLGIQMADADHVPAPVAQAAAPDNAKEKLSEQVRNMVLASEAGRSFAQQPNEAGLLETVTHSARMLFGFADVAILLLDGAGAALRGTSMGEQRQRLAAFSIPLKGGSAIAEAALARRLVFVAQDGASPGGAPLGVAEEQLLRILGTDCLVCVPLIAEDRCLGIMVGGIASWQLADFRQREGFLRAFGAQASSALKTVFNERGKADHRVSSIAEEYREASRRVAHEVSNPLSIIKNYLSVLDRKLAKQELISGEMSILNEEIDRVGQIINGLADLQPAPREGTTELNRVVDDVVRLFRDTEYISPSVRITTQMQDQPFEIDSDADTIKQILMNLIKNAVEALPVGGEIEIGNHGLVNRDGLLYVELWIKDSGPGIPAEVMAKLFTPVRSSKGEGHRGLGLSIVHSLVKRIKGLIACRSGKQGTTFEILLPFRRGANGTSDAKPLVRNSI